MQVLLKNLTMTSQETSDALKKSFGIHTLRNKFSGRKLFRDNYFNLVMGDFEILDNTRNKHFFENIVEFARDQQDINLLPALRKIAYNPALGESIRQQASETMEMIEEGSTSPVLAGKADEPKGYREKIANARKMLSGHRYPQTTEILRLLREKSPELKKLALYLVGKFKMTDMSQEVCECLNNPEISSDAVRVLESLSKEIRTELRKYCLASSGNIVTGRNIIRILGKTCTRDNTEFLFSLLWSNSRRIRETALSALVNCGFKVTDNDRGRLTRMIYDTFGLISWILAAEVCLEKNIDTLLLGEMNNEYSRWKDFASGLLSLLPVHGDKSGQEHRHAGKTDEYSEYLSRISDIVFSDRIKLNSTVLTGGGPYLKMLKKLQKFFPVDVPSYKELLEDLINRDYNTISIWTKVRALRNIAAIEDENLAESVVALLFSPEQILQEEAARLIARTDDKLYSRVEERLRNDEHKKKLDLIINGKVNEKNLLYNKVIFLKSCFPSIQEEKLYFLASLLQYVSGSEEGIKNNLKFALIWMMSLENPIPQVHIIYDSQDSISAEILNSEGGYGYVLPFSALSEFEYQYPEDMMDILKYIDDNEE